MAALASSTASSGATFAPASPLGGTFAAIGTLLAGLRRWHAVRRTIVALGALDDRTLRDIGLDRSELASLAANRGFERLRAPRTV